MEPLPAEMGVPHPEWRFEQWNTIEWILSNSNQMLLVEAPVGSGKSAVCSALGADGDVRVLTHTINLQEQYEIGYDFKALFGLGQYPCAFGIGDLFKADDCMFPEGMKQCPVAHLCEYLLRRDVVKSSNRQALSYAYWLRANWPKESPTDYLYLDEAHLIPGIVKSAATLSFTPKDIEAMDIAPWPKSTTKNQGMMLKMALAWMRQVDLHLKDEYNSIVKVPGENRTINHIRAMRRINDKIQRLGTTMFGIEVRPDDYFVSWDGDEFKLIPLTARLYFNSIFVKGFEHKIILTSATIGNPKVLTSELGIKDYDYRFVPPSYGPEGNPIKILDAPKMGYNTKEAGKRKQARVISRLFNDHDPNWSALVHVSSWYQANDLAKRLGRAGFSDRLWIADVEGNTGDKIQAWQHRMRKVPNTITISPSFRQGLDAYDVDMNVIAKVPFAPLDDFGRAEMTYNPRLYRWNAATQVEQAAGRIRRGDPSHYEVEGEPTRKVVAIADGNHSLIKEEFSDFFKSCMVDY